MARAPMYCANCGTVGAPKRSTKGYFVLEVVLWLFFLLPGLIYSVWRLSTKTWVCPSCAAPNMVPLDSPRARSARADVAPPS